MVEVGRKVKIRYTICLEDGTVVDSSELHEGALLEFVVGTRQVMPGLEKAVSTMDAFEKRKVRIPAREAFGEYDESLIESVPIDSFPDADTLPVGDYITLSIPSGQVRVKVERIEDDVIYFNFNHEYAGCDLKCDIELVDIFGETGSIVENEQHAAGCSCGCHKLKEQLTR